MFRLECRVPAPEATFTLLGFVTSYALLLGLYTYVVGRIIREGPPAGDDLESATESPPADTEVTASG